MRWRALGVALVALVLLAVPSAFADPVARWGGPWLVTPGFSLSSATHDTELRRAFGANARNDEQIQDAGSSFESLPGTQAWAKVFGRSSSSSCILVCGKVFADTSIAFERAFTLQGSPSGEWEVSLVGRLVGEVGLPTIVGAGVQLNPLAFVGGSVSISAVSDPATPLITVSVSHRVDPAGPLNIDDPLAQTGFLPDGIYLVRGILGINTEIEESRFASGTTTADFFDADGAGLRAAVDAAPRVTEQSIIITSVYQTVLHRPPTDAEVVTALAYLRGGGTREGLSGRLLARFIPAL
jgi:hypothetical protein